MVLGKLPGASYNLDYIRARAYCACSRSRWGWGLFGICVGGGGGGGWGTSNFFDKLTKNQSLKKIGWGGRGSGGK